MSSPRQLPSGAWQSRYRDADGRRHTRSFPTKSAATRWKADREADVRRGDHYDQSAGRVTVAVFAEQWMESRGVELTTRSGDRKRLDKHVIPAFGKMPIGRITRLRVQTWIRQLERTPAEGSDKPLAPGTIHGIVRCLSAIMREAAREGLIRTNPTLDLDLPVLPPSRDQVLTREQVEAVIGKLEAPYDLVVLLMAYTGLRWGETCGLRVRGLNLLRRELTVRDVLLDVGGKRIPKSYPKGRAWRTVPLTRRLADGLAAHLAAHPTGRDELVFRGPQGGALSSSFRARQWKTALDEAGIPYVVPHALRHSYGSWLIEAGRPITEVQKLLGHGSVTTTARYLHVVTNDFDGAVTALEDEPIERHAQLQTRN